ncbi:hypothetical protein N9B19_01625 [Akkermansiaceae bacterium]|nr:hypothetical protein [Akkermansiaceae bacterium]MDB4566393.1 hypothetical protein [Akkermansiaceae bacterium]
MNEKFYYDAFAISLFQSEVENPQLADLVPVSPGFNRPPRINTNPDDTYFIRLNQRGSSPSAPFFFDTRLSDLNRRRIITPNTSFEERKSLPPLTSLRANQLVDGLERQVIPETSIFRRITAWWSWTAPETGVYQIKNSSNTGSLISAFVGSNKENLSEVATGDGRGIFFEAEGGTNYHFAVQTNIRNAGSFVGFDLAQIATPPANDQFEKPVDLGEDLSFSILQQVHLASVQANEPFPEGTIPTRTTWFRWLSPTTGSFSFDTSGMDNRITVYRKEQTDALTQLITGTSTTNVTLQEGNIYVISVDSPSAIAFTLSGSLQFPSFTNNNFADAVIWSGNQHTAIGSAALADYEPNEPRPSGAFSSRGSNWWKWTAPQTGATTFTFEMSRFVFTVYRGSSLTSLESIVSHENSLPLRFHAIAGETYYLQLVNNDFDAARESFFQLSQAQDAPDNDLFENAQALSGEPISLTINPSSATIEQGDPGARESIWYSWQAPSDGNFLVISDSGSAARVYRGDSLQSLVALPNQGSQTSVAAVAGEIFHLNLTPSLTREGSLSIAKVGLPSNDDFENRIDLGNIEEVEINSDQSRSTFQDNDPANLRENQRVGTVWWQWTAPRDGLLSVSGNIYFFTGSTLDLLEPLNDGDLAGRISVTGGTTYVLASARRERSSENNVAFRLTMRQLSNDNFADRTIISTELPFNWEGHLPNATVEPFENFNGSNLRGTAWWQWTAPKDGKIRVDFQLGPVDIYRLAHSLAELPLITSNSPALLEVFEGETYLFQVTGSSFSDSNLRVAWDTPNIGNPRGFQDPIEIEIPPLNQENPPIYSHQNIYRWTASKSGTLTITSSGERVRSAIVYKGPDLQSLTRVNSQDTFSSFDWNRFPIVAGQTYWMNWISLSEGAAGWSPTFGPDDDQFASTTFPTATSVWNGDNAWAGLEACEPLLNSFRISRTVWRKWTAPRSGAFCFQLDKHQAAIFEGESIDGLALLAEGRRGIFEAIQGETYHFAVGSSSGGPFEFNIGPVESRYDIWREEIFGENITSQSKPNSDPDQDGRSNVMELALGSDPLSFDNGLPFQLFVRDDSFTLTLSRPEGIEGVELEFEVSSDLISWQPTTDFQHETQTETTGEGQEHYQVIVRDPASSISFARLRAVIPADR